MSRNPRLHRALHPRSRAAKNVRRIIRRLTRSGWHPRTDRHGNKWPTTFIAIIGNALERMAARRKVGGWKHLPAHVGRDVSERERRYYLSKIGGKK